jgi:hypothetical protein
MYQRNRLLKNSLTDKEIKTMPVTRIDLCNILGIQYSKYACLILYIEFCVVLFPSQKFTFLDL